MQHLKVANEYFAEGLTDWKNRLIQITWQSKTGFTYDLKTFEPGEPFHYSGEGWGITHDTKRLIMSDGTSTLRLWPRWMTSAPCDWISLRMMLMAASWPSNRLAAVTKRSGLRSLAASAPGTVLAVVLMGFPWLQR